MQSNHTSLTEHNQQYFTVAPIVISSIYEDVNVGKNVPRIPLEDHISQSAGLLRWTVIYFGASWLQVWTQTYFHRSKPTEVHLELCQLPFEAALHPLRYIMRLNGYWILPHQTELHLQLQARYTPITHERQAKGYKSSWSQVDGFILQSRQTQQSSAPSLLNI